VQKYRAMTRRPISDYALNNNNTNVMSKLNFPGGQFVEANAEEGPA
jgi:hypothetical protein